MEGFRPPNRQRDHVLLLLTVITIMSITLCKTTPLFPKHILSSLSTFCFIFLRPSFFPSCCEQFSLYSHEFEMKHHLNAGKQTTRCPLYYVSFKTYISHFVEDMKGIAPLCFHCVFKLAIYPESIDWNIGTKNRII